MTFATDNRNAGSRPFRSPGSPPLGRAIYEYPVGYVAQLARPFSVRGAVRSERAIVERRAAAVEASARAFAGFRT
jgi:hypothetical protein